MWQNIILWICIALNWGCITLNIWSINHHVKARFAANEQADRLYRERMELALKLLSCADLTKPEE